MPAPKRTKFERERDLERVTQLYLRGKFQSEIAAILDVSQGQISYDIATIEERWQKRADINWNKAKQKELDKLDNLEREYWLDMERYLAAWEASKTERTKSRQETDGTLSKDKKPTVKKMSMEKEQRDGNPAFLDGMIRCKQEIVKISERRCKLLGLDAPTKSEVEVTQPIAITIDR